MKREEVNYNLIIYIDYDQNVAVITEKIIKNKPKNETLKAYYNLEEENRD